MTWWLPSFPYPPAKEGYWLPVTSTLNWCEEDYYATKYSAEIVNSVTNMMFVYLGLRGAINCVRNDHDRIFLIAFIGYMIVGLGSTAFHSTLKYPMQLVDELSMIYTTCLMCFATFSYGKPRRYAWILGTALVGLALFITLYYHYLQDPAFHQNAYAILTAIVLLRAMWIMEANVRPSLAKRHAYERANAQLNGSALSKAEVETELRRRDTRDRTIIRKMWWLVGYGLTIFLTGFAIWTLDNEFCSTLRTWRHQIGLPWGIVLEGHGWWHLFTGIGAYYYIVWGLWLRHCLNGKHDEYELIWPRMFTSLPDVRRVKQGRGREMNGSGKKKL